MENNNIEKMMNQCKKDLDSCMDKYNKRFIQMKELENSSVMKTYKTVVSELVELKAQCQLLLHIYNGLCQQSCLHPIWVGTIEDRSNSIYRCQCIKCHLVQIGSIENFSNHMILLNPKDTISCDMIEKEYDYLNAKDFSEEEAFQLIKKKYDRKNKDKGESYES